MLSRLVYNQWSPDSNQKLFYISKVKTHFLNCLVTTIRIWEFHTLMKSFCNFRARYIFSFPTISLIALDWVSCVENAKGTYGKSSPDDNTLEICGMYLLFNLLCNLVFFREVKVRCSFTCLYLSKDVRHVSSNNSVSNFSQYFRSTQLYFQKKTNILNIKFILHY